MENVGGATENFSGRQIAKLMISLQGAVYGTHAIKLTPELVKKVTERKISENKRKREMAGIDNGQLTAEVKKRKQDAHNYA